MSETDIEDNVVEASLSEIETESKKDTTHRGIVVWRSLKAMIGEAGMPSG